jgi:Protein of unknown function (DUF3592)
MEKVFVLKCIYFVFSIGTCVISFVLYKRTKLFLKNACVSEGIVVSLVEVRGFSNSSRPSITYAPVVNFQDRYGNEIEFTSKNSSYPSAYTEGDRVEILYLLSNPENAKIKDFTSLWLGAVFLGVIGSVLLLSGLYNILKN